MSSELSGSTSMDSLWSLTGDFDLKNSHNLAVAKSVSEKMLEIQNKLEALSKPVDLNTEVDPTPELNTLKAELEQLKKENQTLILRNQQLTKENQEIVSLLKEHEKTLDFVMSKFRSQTLQTKEEIQTVHQQYNTLLEQERSRNTDMEKENIHLKNQLVKLTEAVRIAVRGDDLENEVIIEQLQTENQALREMLEISVTK
ncbi:hypothetical protein K493DRAFT_295860 [Basidiobolus meristosporus CBS 931.73]|uniref:TATA element modulatory factor 1 TATA binding domain-containing protein n=1 Tax=Basidiobolus meristosporus CBS 931.73 TaxID=1314790 RepID=A0A1Y1Z8Z7_9FUNG|nr:hypothetical protein K493DRAFT_295860 [Basidiobolus meristosporus CBS 931.73]|eukprot:ORY06721.1 hypothetical protein K493DRAFT_295860 [Basidiobolus meristosporus CBS 931.73]